VRGGWLVGLAGVLVVAYITVNSLRTEGVGSRGPVAGERLPPFAAPFASLPVGDDTVANVGANACAVRGRGILNVCALAERGPVVLTFAATGVERCERQVDVVDRVAARFPDVEFAVVGVRGDREALLEAQRRHGWGIPVAHDREGSVASVYAVVVCPFVTFARRGGEVTGSALSFLDDAALAARVEALR
jgi:hypothetical protein